MSPLIVGIVGLVGLVGVLVWDVFLAIDDIGKNTISEVVRIVAKKTTIVPWFAGVIAGHWFHPVDNLKPILGQPQSIATLIWLTCVFVLVGIAFVKEGHPIPPWAVFVVAIGAGTLLWPV